MKISPLNYPKSKINQGANTRANSPLSKTKSYSPKFTSERLYSVILEKRAQSGSIPIPAYFSKLNSSDISDIEAMADIKRRIGNSSGGFCGKFISSHFLLSSNCSRDFYAIELDDETKPLKDRIVSIAEIDDYIEEATMKRTIKINFIQSLHNIGQINQDAIRGGGLACLYGITKFASENNTSRIWLQSTENGFYEHNNYGEKTQTGELTWYDLYQKDYGNFLHKVEQKYGFDSYSN